ncbi:hypothetical protein K1719_040858 [Acacia pycnantha]|nr:hypothetical protein K1719_040858 [Acacia pycnantha]
MVDAFQDVYLKRGGGAHTSLIASSKISNPAERLSSVESHEGRNKSTKIQGQCPVDHVIFDLAKFIGREKVPSKVLKDVGELTSQTLSQAQNHQPLSGSTIFNRIEIPASSDPSDLEFYEYVEAFKLIGDPYVPAGQIMEIFGSNSGGTRRPKEVHRTFAHQLMAGRDVHLREDYHRVLKGRPWSIQNTMLNLQSLRIQFHGLPHVAFDCGNAITLGNAIGRTLMYEIPTIQGRLSRTFIRTCVLLNILNPQSEDTEDATTDARVGNGLGTHHVRTMEEVLVAHDLEWEESKLLARKPTTAAGQATNRRLAGEKSQQGNSGNHGGNITNLSLCSEEGEDGRFNSNIPTPVIFMGGPSISFPRQSSCPRFQGHFPEKNSDQPPPANQPPPYQVEYPTSEAENSKALVPFVGLSPLSAVTTGLSSETKAKGRNIPPPKIEELMDREENYWWQRSRISWLKSEIETQNSSTLPRLSREGVI